MAIQKRPTGHQGSTNGSSLLMQSHSANHLPHLHTIGLHICSSLVKTGP